MNRALLPLVLLAGLVGGAVYVLDDFDGPKAAPTAPIDPPCPDCPKKPAKPKRPWGESMAAVAAPCACAVGCRCVVCNCAKLGKQCCAACACPKKRSCEPLIPGKISLGGPVSPDNECEVMIDYPTTQRMGNIGSHVDGAGMCVMTSIEMAARCCGLDQFRGLRDWCAKEPGGAGPSKVDRQLKAYCKAKGIPVPPYVQYEGDDVSTVAMVLRTCRLPCVTYGGRDGVRYNGPIAHMVCCSHLDQKWACLLDNNGGGANGVPETGLLWMSPEEFAARFKMGGGGWMFAWMAPPWPPVPRNK